MGRHFRSAVSVLMACASLRLPVVRAAEDAVDVTQAATASTGGVSTPEASPQAAPKWILLEADGSFSRPALERIRADLAVGLQLTAAEVFLAAPVDSSAPVAKIVLSQTSRGLVTVEVQDYLTDKRLARDIDLSSLPNDGHALALAQAGEELLRASWAELDLARSASASSGAAPAPAAPRTLAPASVQPSPPATRRWVVGLRPALEWWSAGQGFWGADVALRYRELRWFVELRAGLRDGFVVSSERGQVSSQSFLFSGWAGLDLLSAPLWLLAPEVGLQLGEARFEGQAEAGNRGSQVAGLVGSARAGLALGVEPLPLAFTLDAGVGAPLATVRATSEGEPVTGAAGVELWSGLSAGAAF